MAGSAGNTSFSGSGGTTAFSGQANPSAQFNTQSAYNNFAAPNQNLSGGMQMGQMPQGTQSPQGGQWAQPSNSQQNQQWQPQQPSQPQSQPMAPGQAPPALSTSLPAVSGNQSPDVTGIAAGSDTGFDGSRSDAGVGGKPVNQMQTPVQGMQAQPAQQGNAPPSLSQYMTPQGLQILGNPTAMPLQRSS